ncbi:MAG: DUF1501 domain-containing protein [Bacteroidia bacterium]
MTKYSRKDFLKLTGLASASLLIPNFLKGSDTAAQVMLNNILLPATNGKRLIVIQLSGGNDGLNTIVPHGDDLYYSNRKGIGLRNNELIRIDDHFSFNAQLKSLADLYNAGNVSIINSVGYPNPNRSHFRSLDIWQSASDADKYIQTGWVGRWLDSCCNGQDVRPHLALEIDEQLSLAMKGDISKGLAMLNPKRLIKLAQDPVPAQTAKLWTKHDDDEHHVEYLHKTLAETVQSADYLHEHAGKNKSKSLYPQHAFGKQMKMIAELILSDCETGVYYVSLPGFDTHAGQKNQQNRLLKIYADALKALSDDLKSAGKWNDTLIMTFSEFGRRVKQNASGGTDHGTANVMIFAGGSMKQRGILNDAPDLKNLSEGDLIYKVDFRSVYATVLQNWLGADAGKILSGKFDRMNFV